MSECACNRTSPHNGKKTAYFTDSTDSSVGEYGPGDPGSGWTFGQRNKFLIWLFSARVAWLKMITDRLSYI